MSITEFFIKVTMPDDESSAKVEIGCHPSPPPLAAIMVAAEHMANAMAMHGDDYERSLTLLCEGARKVKVLVSNGHRTQ
jgi:hypothetical protein